MHRYIFLRFSYLGHVLTMYTVFKLLNVQHRQLNLFVYIKIHVHLYFR